MIATPSRLIDIAVWPVSVWMSFAQFSRHADDDYVERTSPIVAFALVFWAVVAALATAWFMNGPRVLWSVLWFFLPLIYVIGLWMYSERQSRYPH
ncbi:MAG: hypothetical protein AB7L65_04080 [Hyphomonadaceae bacterium]